MRRHGIHALAGRRFRPCTTDSRHYLPLAALMMAAQRQRPAEDLVCHSDRGSQYAAEAYAKQLAAMKATPSMSRTARCYDCEKVRAVWKA